MFHKKRKKPKPKKAGDYGHAPKGMFLIKPRRRKKDWSWNPPRQQ